MVGIINQPFLWWLPFGKAPEITPEELHRWLEENRTVQLLDARTGIEFGLGTIAGAKHAPVTELPASINRLDLDPAHPVVLLCATGHRSLPGTRLLRAKGMSAYSLKGGIGAWSRKGYPITKSVQ